MGTIIAYAVIGFIIALTMHTQEGWSVEHARNLGAAIFVGLLVAHLVAHVVFKRPDSDAVSISTQDERDEAGIKAWTYAFSRIILCALSIPVTVALGWEPVHSFWGFWGSAAFVFITGI